MSFQPGDIVRFSRFVVRGNRTTASARGTVLSVADQFARVDFHGTWFTHENGSTVRTVPVANLVRASRSNVIRIGSREFIRNVRGRCEDAPCCGCCTI